MCAAWPLQMQERISSLAKVFLLQFHIRLWTDVPYWGVATPWCGVLTIQVLRKLLSSLYPFSSYRSSPD